MGSKCGRVLAVAAHDLRTPLAVVAGYLGLLLRQHKGPLSRRQRELLGNMEKAVESLSKLVTQLSDLSSLESQTLLLNRQEVRLAALIKDASAELVRNGAGKITLRGAIPRASLIGDQRRLRAAFSTLFATAMREMMPPQSIVVQQVLQPARSGTSAVIAIGAHSNVEQLLTVPARRLTAFDTSNGARNLEALIACRVITAHGGETWMLRRQHDGPGVMIRLPITSS